ncbi:MAG: galactose ABC transporter substrate-binding protein [Spirochaetaceae bacterium]
MKKVILLLITILLLGCMEKEKKASLFIYNYADPFMELMQKYIIQETKNKLSLEIIDSQNFQIIQNENIEERILAGDDLMIINPVDRLGVYSIIKKLKSKDIPVIFFNREPLAQDLNLWDKAYYVGTKGVQSAHFQAELIATVFGNIPKKLNKYDKNNNGLIETIILKGEQGHQDAEIRTTEVVDSLKAKGFKLNILAIEVANWNKIEAYEKMQPIISEFQNEIELVISNNDSMAIGAVNAFRLAGMFKDSNGNKKIDKNDDTWIPIVGIDGLEETVELINSGYIYGTVLNDSRAQAKAIAELSDCLLNNKSFDNMSFKLENGKYILVDYKILQ